VQRIFVHEAVADAFITGLIAATAALPVGDPLDDRTRVGPMISEAEARRAEAWIDAAVRGGARILTGGRRAGSMLEPTILTGTRPEMRVCAEEVFAPVVVVERFRDLRDAIAAVDGSTYGLQAGIFTRDLAAAFAAWEGIEVGAVVVNDAPTFRADAAPYGGVKGSGLGREGPRYAIEDFTEMRLLVVAPGTPCGA
jgi:acyl-CoA reductase-like NAD-dependent aldehyde dehydrogenase